MPVSIVSQVLGAIAAGVALFVIASCKNAFDVSSGFGANGYGAHSSGGYSLTAGLVTEVVMTMMLLTIILGATDERAPQGLAPVAVGLGLTLIHLMVSPCLTLIPGRANTYGGFEKRVSGGDPGSFEMMTALFSTSDCSGSSVGPPVSIDLSTSGWNKVSGSFAPGAGQESVRLVVEVRHSGEQAFRVLLDDVLLGVGLTPGALIRFSVE